MQKALLAVAGVAASLGALLPGASYFTDHAPPFFRTIGLLTSGAAAVVLITSYALLDRRRNLPKLALISIGIGCSLLVAYEVLTGFWTVEPPPGRESELHRDQIGFGVAEWSLTEKGLDNKRMARELHLGDPTPTLLVQMNAAYGDDEKIRTIWHWWSIVSTGSILLLLFCLGFLSWTFGFAALARHVRPEKLP